jgi:SagB-type dehydrogenase family enzyme
MAQLLESPSRRAETGDDSPWELFHENSKTGRYDGLPPLEYIRQRMARLLEALPYDQYPAVDLPVSPLPLETTLAEALAGRVTARGLEPGRLTVTQLATLLHYAYGVTRSNEGTVFPRPFRVVPSGGALYPLELFFHSTHVDGLQPGLYHYHPLRRNLRFLRYGDESRRLAEALVQRDLALDTAIVIFITAIFERSVFKYGDRGYRFVLLEAGHVAQNLNLVAGALGFGSVNIGGYFDRQVDELLGLDGLAHSTVYLVGVGRPSEWTPTSEPP